MNSSAETPTVITSARAARSDDIRRRQLRYLISMGIRTSCFVLAFVASGPLRWALLTGAVFLPYVAVVVANTSTSRQAPPPRPYSPGDLKALEGPPVERR